MPYRSASSSLLTSLIFITGVSIITLFSTIFFLIPALLLPRPAPDRIGGLFTKVILAWYHFCTRTRLNIQGEETLPKQGPFILAAKHQSIWETFFLFHYLKSPFIIIKREVLYAPIFGWVFARINVIPLNRAKGIESVRALKASSRHIKENHPQAQLMIFPEGTRRHPSDKDTRYLPGIYVLYKDLDCPVYPFSHNAGSFWPKNLLKLHRGGTIEGRFLPPIPPGLSKEEFEQALINSIEKTAQELRTSALAQVKP